MHVHVHVHVHVHMHMHILITMEMQEDITWGMQHAVIMLPIISHMHILTTGGHHMGHAARRHHTAHHARAADHHLHANEVEGPVVCMHHVR